MVRGDRRRQQHLRRLYAGGGGPGGLRRPRSGKRDHAGPHRHADGRERPGTAERPLAIHEQLPTQRVGRPGRARPSSRRSRPTPANCLRAGGGSHHRGHLVRPRAPGNRQPSRRGAGRRRRPRSMLRHGGSAVARGSVVEAPAVHGPPPAPGVGAAGHRPWRAGRGSPPGDRGAGGAPWATGRRSDLDGRVRHRRCATPRSPRGASRSGRGGPPPRRAGRPRRSAAPGEDPAREHPRQRYQHRSGVGGPPARRRRRDVRRQPPLRALCDVQTSRQQLLFSHTHLGELARALAGLDVRYPPYIS